MKLHDLKNEIRKYQYLEDTQIIDVALASVIATRLKLGDPVWLVIIGASSGGKSQILRPLSLTDTGFLHRDDDMTENTFLSGIQAKDKESVSLLNRIGPHGMIVISDLTVLFSKNSDARGTILSQFRMIYDGEMTKFSGNRREPLKWQGYLGVVAGSTPTIYSHFEEVSDMGERFIYYRMKEYDEHKATHLALSRKTFGKELDDTLSDLYGSYIKEVVTNAPETPMELSEEIKERIIEVSTFAERIRTVAQVDKFTRDITRIPVSAFPMRVALQLTTIAKALMVIRRHETGNAELLEEDLSVLDWCAYSLANEEKRAVLKVLASVDFEHALNTATIADRIGLSTVITGNILQNLASTGVLKRTGSSNSHFWTFRHPKDYTIAQRIEHIKETEVIQNREMTADDNVEDTDDLVQGDLGATTAPIFSGHD